MKLEKVLDHLNSFEKNAFLKIFDSIISESPNIRKISSGLGHSSIHVNEWHYMQSDQDFILERLIRK